MTLEILIKTYKMRFFLILVNLLFSFSFYSSAQLINNLQLNHNIHFYRAEFAKFYIDSFGINKVINEKLPVTVKPGFNFQIGKENKHFNYGLVFDGRFYSIKTRYTNIIRLNSGIDYDTLIGYVQFDHQYFSIGAGAYTGVNLNLGKKSKLTLQSALIYNKIFKQKFSNLDSTSLDFSNSTQLLISRNLNKTISIFIGTGIDFNFRDPLYFLFFPVIYPASIDGPRGNNVATISRKHSYKLTFGFIYKF